MADKWITVKFLTNEKKYAKKMEEASKALDKAMEAGMSKGEVTINHVEIKIDNATGSS